MPKCAKRWQAESEKRPLELSGACENGDCSPALLAPEDLGTVSHVHHGQIQSAIWRTIARLGENFGYFVPSGLRVILDRADSGGDREDHNHQVEAIDALYVHAEGLASLVNAAETRLADKPRNRFVRLK